MYFQRELEAALALSKAKDTKNEKSQEKDTKAPENVKDNHEESIDNPVSDSGEKVESDKTPYSESYLQSKEVKLSLPEASTDSAKPTNSETGNNCDKEISLKEKNSSSASVGQICDAKEKNSSSESVGQICDEKEKNSSSASVGLIFNEYGDPEPSTSAGLTRKRQRKKVAFYEGNVLVFLLLLTHIKVDCFD